MEAAGKDTVRREALHEAVPDAVTRNLPSECVGLSANCGERHYRPSLAGDLVAHVESDADDAGAWYSSYSL